MRCREQAARTARISRGGQGELARRARLVRADPPAGYEAVGSRATTCSSRAMERHGTQALVPTGGSRPQLGIASRGPSSWDDGTGVRPVNDMLRCASRAMGAV